MLFVLVPMGGGLKILTAFVTTKIVPMAIEKANTARQKREHEGSYSSENDDCAGAAARK